MIEEYDYNFKIDLIGEYVQLYASCDEYRRMEAGVIIDKYMYHLESEAIIKCDVLDFYNPNKNRLINLSLEAAGYIIVYNIYDKANSLAYAYSWLNKLRDISGPDIVVSLIGNKGEYYNKKRTVSKIEGAQFAKENGLLFEDINWSSKEQVKCALKNLAKAIIDRNIKMWDSLLPANHDKT